MFAVWKAGISIAIGIMNDFFRAQLYSAKIEIRNTCQEKDFV